MIVFKDPAPAATSTPERKDSSSKVETAVQVPFIIFSSRKKVREVHTLPLLLTRYHHASWKAAHRLKKPTPRLPKLRSITQYSWPLLMCTTHFADMHLFIHSICVWHRRSCTEKRSPTLSTGSNWPRREGNIPELFTTHFFPSGRRWRPACWRTRSCTPA